MRRGIATFTLDYGTCPPWLYERMVKLGRAMTHVLVDEYGPNEFIKRIADPVWFQSLGTLLAFDWNASGLTTILTAALKEAIRDQEEDLGIFICGGKGRTARKTPFEIRNWGEFLALPNETTDQLIYNSKMAAKVDSSLVQDDYQIYHHAFFFSRDGSWAVVQQGMNTETKTARRYHWYNEMTDSNDSFSFVNEPHSGIMTQYFRPRVLNLTASESLQARNISIKLAQDGIATLKKDVQLIRKYASNLSQTATIQEGTEQLTLLNLEDTPFTNHPVELENFTASPYLEKILYKIAEEKPDSYEQLLSLDGVGPKTLRALALVAEVIYDAPPSYEDPARYSFAHGGKDDIPYPVDKETYDQVIDILHESVQKAALPQSEKDSALKRLRDTNE
jgi:uncharacterized protein